MKQVSVIFQYHNRSYDLVKIGSDEFVRWEVYTYSINGRGEKLFGFTDVKFNYEQAEHVAKHIMLNYESGVQAGRKQIKQELKNLVDTQLD